MPRHSVEVQHPGGAGGRRRGAPGFTKGRQLDTQALDEVRAVLGAEPRRRDLLIEHLHRIQDRFGGLSAAHLVALADEMRLALSEVYEVATFYAHFDVVLDADASAAGLTVRVCDSLSCELAGAQELLRALQQRLGDGVRVVRAPCMGRCDAAPTVEVGHHHLDRAEVEQVAASVDAQDVQPVIPAYRDLEAYTRDGGYRVLRECLDGSRERDAVVSMIEDSALRGMGGAGFPSARKWSIVRGYAKPRLMAVNADEGEPGTFKDRYFLETDPHRFLEGMLIAAWVVEAREIYVYLRDEYPAAHRILARELARLHEQPFAPEVAIQLRRGAGAYICGEESAMLESIEGKRGLPRHRPPYVAERGLFGRPTLVHNVETLYWVPQILARGAQWFAEQGRNGRKGLRSYSVSGRVKQPGVKIAPAGITARELIDEYCGGMQEGHRFKGYLPGGASGGILPAALADLPLEFGALEEHGCFIGSAAVVVLSDRDDMRAVALNLMRFFEDESCGQCTPCRVGTEKAVTLLQAESWDLPLLEELGAVMTDASICGLGQAAANPVKCVVRYFPEDLQ